MGTVLICKPKNTALVEHKQSKGNLYLSLMMILLHCTSVLTLVTIPCLEREVKEKGQGSKLLLICLTR